ncbi:ABC transporter substrate-binding protein [Cohnella nanjingensis]|uniref:Extracellular solute-binding protein n=1 Tax=Cohnella nanjingensis TaxID=1387779 RepID=A0A7X0VGJ4_9BACL|nr:extracellular solute-binding protein [Cohnella nanjingensis]MBB6673180.1 extracellular solute-binding protein [Cohnella nanjingensis]
MKPHNKKIRRVVAGGMALSMLVPLLAACSSGDNKDPNNRHTLRIGTMYGSSQDEYWFRQQYTDLFEYSHNNIDIEIVPAIDYTENQFEEPEKQQQPVDQLAKVKAIMTGANPVDIMIIDQPSLLSQLVQENLVKPLDPMIKEDKIDTTAFVPTVIDGIKELGGDNQLYALTPTFMPSALYYNKTLFQKAGVELPTDGMSWDDVFNMAKRLASGKGGKDGTYGFTFNQWGGSDPYSDVTNYVAPLKMKIYDDKAEKMTVNTDQWANAWTKIVDLYKNHVVPTQEDMQAIYSSQQNNDGKGIYNPYQNQLFFMGKSAMMIGQYNMLNDIETFNKNYEKLKMPKLEWDVVTVPQFTNEAPGIGTNINLSTLSAINAKAANPDDAWEFVKFMNGEEWAKFKSRSSYEMPSRKAFIKPRDGMTYNLDAFTKLKPAPQKSLSETKIEQERQNLYLIGQLGQTEFNKVMQGQKTVKEALKEFEEKGNDLLQKIKLKPNGPIDGVGGDVYGGGGPIMYRG